MEENPVGQNDLPVKPITIADCGELTDANKLTAESASFLKSYEEGPKIMPKAPV